MHSGSTFLSRLRMMFVGIWLGPYWVLFSFFDHCIQSSVLGYWRLCLGLVRDICFIWVLSPNNTAAPLFRYYFHSAFFVHYTQSSMRKVQKNKKRINCYAAPCPWRQAGPTQPWLDVDARCHGVCVAGIGDILLDGHIGQRPPDDNRGVPGRHRCDFGTIDLLLGCRIVGVGLVSRVLAWLTGVCAVLGHAVHGTAYTRLSAMCGCQGHALSIAQCVQ